MAKCSFKNCDIEAEILLYHIDNGKEKIVLCPNHSVSCMLSTSKTSPSYNLTLFISHSPSFFLV